MLSAILQGRSARTVWVGILERLLVSALLFMLTPGVQECAADLAHFVADGHTFHDEGHEAPDHCCSGAFHFCSCHASTPATPVTMTALSFGRLPEATGAQPTARMTGGPADAHALETNRPPAA